MAAPHLVFQQALAELSSCLCRVPPQTQEGCAELLQAAVAWAAPGSEADIEQKVPERAVVLAKASLKLLKAAVAGQAKDESALSSEEVYCSTCSTSDQSVEGDAPSRTLVTEATDGNVQTGFTDDTQPHPGSSGECPFQGFQRYAAAPLLLLCGAHTQEWPWTSEASRTHTKLLLRSLLKLSGCDTVTDLLRGAPDQQPACRIFNEALELLSPRLCKETWESNPDAKLVFSWMLHQVSRPWLSEFLSRIMPPSLLLSDDYRRENKLLGISCLHHIIKNVPAADLRQFNRALVVYHALRNHLYTTDTAVTEASLSCILDLLPVVQKSPPAIGEYQKEADNPADQIMQLVLTNMEMEHRIDLRRLYARFLPTLQDRLQFRVIRHMKRLMNVIVGYLEVYDGLEETSRLCILETLQGTIKYAWPRIPCRVSLLLKALLKLMYEVTCEPTPVPESVTEALLCRATDCLVLLNQCCKGRVKTALEGILSLCNEPRLVNCIKKVQQSA
uniref:TELO2 interacting protein 2 n=1 Tax=Leptobrachium leishanense TaxID=445787 RepID=A0A8C5WCR1_9ANUR